MDRVTLDHRKDGVNFALASHKQLQFTYIAFLMHASFRFRLRAGAGRPHIVLAAVLLFRSLINKIILRIRN